MVPESGTIGRRNSVSYRSVRSGIDETLDTQNPFQGTSSSFRKGLKLVTSGEAYDIQIYGFGCRRRKKKERTCCLLGLRFVCDEGTQNGYQANFRRTVYYLAVFPVSSTLFLRLQGSRRLPILGPSWLSLGKLNSPGRTGTDGRTVHEDAESS
jgi:hypothetical protein